MVEGGSAQAAREALRRFALLNLAPRVRRIEAELRRKIDPTLRLTPPVALMDLQGRATAAKALAHAEALAEKGVDVERILERLDLQ